MLFTPDPGLIIWTVISFFALFFLLAKFGYKPIVTALENREKTIRESLETAKNTQREAEKLFEESKEELTDVREEVQKLVDRARTEGENIEKKIIEKANEEARNIIMRAQNEIRLETEKAMRGLRTQMADLTFDIASKVTQKSLDKKDHFRLIEDYIKEVDSLHEH